LIINNPSNLNFESALKQAVLIAAYPAFIPFLHKNSGRVFEYGPPPIHPRFFPTSVFSITL